MRVQAWFRRLTSHLNRSTRPRSLPRRSRLGVERLEERDNPSGGLLDTTFNGTGSRALPSATMRFAIESVVQSDGKIVTVGAPGNPTPDRGTIVRMNSDGSLDTSFNGTGKVLLPQKVGSVTISACRCVVLQPDGKILVGLAATKLSGFFNSDPYFAVVRLNANGSVDTSFGTNGGYWLANLQPGNGSSETLLKLAQLPGGSVIIGGGAKAADGFTGFAAVKLTPSGQTDTTFGIGGMTVVHVGTNSTANLAVGSLGLSVTPTGGVIFAGSAVPVGATTIQGCIVALTPSGQLDTGFNGTGYVFAGFYSQFRSVALQGNSVVVAGSAQAPGSSQGVVARYTLSGAFDTTFGADGYFFNPTDPPGRHIFSDVKVASDGSLVVCAHLNYKDANGATHYRSQVAHLLSNGDLDTSFGPAGTGIVSLPDTAIGYLYPSIAIGPDGKILLTPGFTGAMNVDPVFYRFTAW